MSKTQFERLANQLIEEAIKIDTVVEVNEASKIDFGVMLEVNNVVKKGVKKLIGIVYDFTKDKSTIWVETKDDIYKVPAEDVKVVENKKPQAKTGFNGYKTKLTESVVRDIYFMATTSKMSHKAIAGWVLLHYGIEIVPKTVSDIKLGKRWKKLGLVKGV